MKRIIFILVITSIFSLKSQAQTEFRVTSSSTPSCSDNGTLTITFDEGAAPYEVHLYHKISGDIVLTNINSPSYTFTSLMNGNYDITVSDVYHNVSYTKHTIESTFQVEINITPESCDNNGTVEAIASGGSSPYNYLWSSGENTPLISNLSNTMLNLSVTDNNNCIFHSDSLFVPYRPKFNININTTNITCEQKGTATAVVNGVDAPYNYYWNTSPIQTSAKATNLPEGQYSVRVTDNTGCSQTFEYVYIYTENAFSLQENITHERCEESNGSITVNPSGGTAPYSYLWSNEETSNSISNLKGHTLYDVTVTDGLGCISKNRYWIQKNSPLQSSFTNTKALCDHDGGGGGSSYVFINNGTPPYTYEWSNKQTTSSINNISSGYYTVLIKDALGCETYKYTYIEEQQSCYATIRGKIIMDLNDNCTEDDTDKGSNYARVVLNNFNYIVYTDENGNYELKVIPGSYTISSTPPNNWIANCSSSVTLDALNGGEDYTAENMYIKPLNIITDASINIYASGQRPGFTGNVYLQYFNNGTQTTSGNIEYTFSNDWDFYDSNPMPSSYDVNTRKATWTYDNLTPFEMRNITIRMTVASNVALGTELHATCSISTLLNDDNLVNNSDGAATTVRGSFDPNDIQVSPQGEGEEGYITHEEEMTYRIRFQNTGTASAFNVSVTNQLDENLEDYTLTILDASHEFKASIKDHMITFDFLNINLPDSNENEPKSHGYVLYKITRKSNLDEGTKIYNQANIYFDYNDPVVTNRVQNTIASSSKTSPISEQLEKVLYYPNPCQSHINMVYFTAEPTEISTMLYSTSGQCIPLLNNLHTQSGQQSLSIDLEQTNISNGLFIIKTIIGNKVFTDQLLIQK